LATEKFRQELRKEAQDWEAEGLIDSEAYQKLADRYQFNELETASRDRFVMILLGLGSTLLGLAIITFVAANWQAWPNTVKLILLSSLFLVINIVGFNLSRQSGAKSRLGNGLLLLGAFVFGANLAFMSQVFHQTGPVYKLYLVWALGVVLMALGLELSFLGILALILTIFAYIWGISNMFSPWEFSFFALFLEHLPLVIALVFIPLAYWCQSPWLFSLSAIVLVISFPTNLLTVAADFNSFSPLLGGIITASAYTLPPSLLWGYRDDILPLANRYNLCFTAITKNLSILILSILLYICSFNVLWSSSPNPGISQLSFNKWLIFGDILVFLGLTITLWWKNRFTLDVTSLGIALINLITGIIIIIHLGMFPLGGLATFVFNVLLFVLGIGLLKAALGTGERSSFWMGIIIIVLQLMSRMLEYDTGLLLKAVILFLCGVVVIVAGLWFERYISNLNTNR